MAQASRKLVYFITALNFAAETGSFPALPPIDFLTGFDLDVEFRPSAFLQKSRNGSDLVGVEFGAPAKFNNNLVEGGLSDAVFGKVNKRARAWYGCERETVDHHGV